MKVIHQNNIIKESGNIVSRFRNITHSITERRNNMTHAFMIMFLSFVGMFLGFIMPLALSNITNSVVFAESFQSQEDVTFTFVPTVNISISGDLIISDLATSSTSDSNQITVTTSSNNAVGYTLGSTVGSSSNASTELRKDGTSTTTKFSSITTNKATLASFSDSNWGYSYSTDNGSNWKSGDITGTTQAGYNGLPIYTSSSPIKLINSNTNGSNSVKFKIGAKASSSQIAGTYTNTINFIGVPKVIATTYTISYNDPSGEATNMPTQQGGTDTTGYGAINISSTQPTRSNYLFKGWCTAQTTDDTCSGDTIKPGHLLALNPGASSMTPTVTKTLYAMWGTNNDAPGQCTDKATCMQTLASCPTTPTTVTDARDGQQYTIAKLADGRCWMTRNLAIGCNGSGSTYGSSISSKSLTSADSNVSTTWSTPTAEFNSSNNSDSGGWNTPAMKCDSTYGAWYNYVATTAGTISGSSNYADATKDICPAGWRLPTLSEFSGITSQVTAFSPVRGGYYNNGNPADINGGGWWWSATAYSTEYGSPARYRLYYGVNGNLSAGDFGNFSYRYSGGYVRCIMKAPSMQSATPESLATAMPNVSDSTTLRDERDDKEYTVAKLADGKYWMTTNLDLAGGTALSADDTDVSSSYISSFSTSNNLTKTGSTIVIPASSQSGFNTDNYSYVYNNPGTDCPSSGCYGYYSWDAVTLGSGRNISTDNTDAPYSICPKGWRLPTSRTTDATNWQTSSDFYAMAHHYGLDSTTETWEEDSDFYDQAGPGTVPNFLLAGYYYNSNFYRSNYDEPSSYWSATSFSSTSKAYSLTIYYGVGSADYSARSYGKSVRCLFGS